MSWLPSDPSWEEGCRDAQMADLEDRETMAILRPYLPGARVLDLGAGSGLHSRLMFPGEGPTRVDLHPSARYGVRAGDARDLRFDNASFDLVHMRRLLSNVPLKERPGVVAEARRVLAPNGVLAVADVFNPHHDRIDAARVRAGLPKLPAQHRGLGFLWATEFTTLGAPIANVPLGADYYLWTRLTLPIIMRQETPWAATCLRAAYPALPERVRDEFGVHRLLVWRKS